MKSNLLQYTKGLLCGGLLLGAGQGLVAQNVACLGEMVTIELDSTRGLAQWQKSTDGVNFVSIAGEVSIQTQQTITERSWFRAYHITEMGCDTVFSDVVEIEVSDIAADAGPDHRFCEGLSEILGGIPTGSGGAGSYTYLWSPATGLSSTTVSNPTASPTVTTTYIVTVTDAQGCTAVDSVQVTVDFVTTGTMTFAGTGGAQFFAIPPCTDTLHIELWGSQGGDGAGTNRGTGGNGSYVAGDIPYVPGLDTLHIFVGTRQGYNGGGVGGTGGNAGGAGGGRTDVRYPNASTNDIVAIAGGGGGGAGGGLSNANNGGNGGNAGNLFSASNGQNNPQSLGGRGGNGATNLAGGNGGNGGTNCNPTASDPGVAGVSLNGGRGGNGAAGICAFAGSGGGGGGGGYYGGGGGGSGPAGGASSFGGGGGGGGTSSAFFLLDAVFNPGVRTGDGQVTISW